MTELYEKISVLLKSHPMEIWTGLIFFAILLIVVIFLLVRRKRRRKIIEQQRIEEVKRKKNEAEKLVKDKRIKEEIEANYKRKIEEEKKTISKSKTSVKSKSEYKQPKQKTEKISEPDIKYKSEPKITQNTIEVVKTESKRKSTEKLPAAKKEDKVKVDKTLFVNYKLDLPESKDSFAVLRCPKMDCVVRTHRYGNTKRRGFKEEVFQNSIEKYFGNLFEISGNVRLNTGKDIRPFEPDIAIIEKGNTYNLRIDIEIDEPYAGLTRQPTHCKGDDLMRDTYFIDRGWIVIRFSEYQVHTQELECLKFTAQVIKKVDCSYFIPTDLESVSDLKPEKVWNVVQAQKWEKEKFREKYLHHEFGEVFEEKETVERDFNEQENNEEEFVKPSIIGVADEGKKVGFNKTNAHPRDKRISFYPENHVYIVDNMPLPSASTIIGKFFPEFDTEYWSNRKAPELGMSPIEVAYMWRTKGEKAAQEGTFLHEQIENYYLNQGYERTAEFDLFEKFVEANKDITPYRTEWRIFDEDYGVAGTIDLISKNGKDFEIYDWKRSKKVINRATGEPIVHNQWQSGIGKLSDIPDTSYNRYCLQQSLYRYILENKYNLEISKMYLIVLYPDYDTYYKVPVPYWKERIEYILKTV
ncbi:hypothetical protein [Ancylomarina longa]|uniref:Uncharacterized protein n=1 Tax=Ancylomarina longa TaxID=2487017 RepID=A0A434AVV4_9BACT|nr:hypothetical protein [Ancylomarina longa]RUT78513.1 hypothetical protein DLK05_08025 [Ancylomarina longa]